MSLCEELWEAEHLGIKRLTGAILGGMVPADTDAFLGVVYPELWGVVSRFRGWLNPLASVYTVYHFYKQGVMVLSEYDASGVEKTYGVSVDELMPLVAHGALVILLGRHPCDYDEGLLEALLDAQGCLPSVYRLTMTFAALYTEAGGKAGVLCEKLNEDTDPERYTRLCELAVFGYEGLALRLEEEGVPTPVVRVVHHVLVEPVVDSLYSLAVYTRHDVELLKALGESSVAAYIAGRLLKLGKWVRLRVPTGYKREYVYRLVDDPRLDDARERIWWLRVRLARLAEENPEDAAREAERLAIEAAGIAEEVNRVFEKSIGLSDKVKSLLGILLSPLLPSLGSGLAASLLEAVLGSAAERAAGRMLDKIIARRETRVEEVLVAPLLPLLYEERGGSRV